MNAHRTTSARSFQLQGLVPAPDDEGLRQAVEALAAAGGDSVGAILLYGSHVQNSSPDRWSAYDFLLITDAYRSFFRSLVAGGHHGRPAWVLTTLSNILPPNIISFDPGQVDGPGAKCAVVTPRHFRRALGPNSPDHFLKGRVVQKLAFVWSRGPEEETMVLSALREARYGIVHWVRPFLRGDFDLERFAETMLRVSYRGEIRPESPGRVEQVFQSQRDILMAIGEESLEAAVQRGKVLRIPEGYRWAKAPGNSSRWAYSLYFSLSKTRAFFRWFKYILTFEGWVEYITRKIERRAGFVVEVTERERRWPLIFLWPKMFRVLAAVKRADEGIPPGNGETSA
ncbi:MAG: hypothetical protein ACWGSQ_07375 [Longimicrobiales bacterium]